LSTGLLASTSGTAIASNEIFHFICFLPINDRLYELDGLKPYPVDHGPIQNVSGNKSGNHVNSSVSQLIDKLAANSDAVLASLGLQQCLANLLSNTSGSLRESTHEATHANWTNKFKNIIKQRLANFNKE
jgi:hypothetical protein